MSNQRNRSGRLSLAQAQQKYNQMQQKILAQKSKYDAQLPQRKSCTQQEKENNKNCLNNQKVATCWLPFQKPLDLDLANESKLRIQSINPVIENEVMREFRAVEKINHSQQTSQINNMVQVSQKAIIMVNQSQQTSQINNMDQVSEESNQRMEMVYNYEKMEIEQPYPIIPTNPENFESQQSYNMNQPCVYCRKDMMQGPIEYCFDCCREFVHHPCAFRTGIVTRTKTYRIVWFCNNCMIHHYQF